MRRTVVEKHAEQGDGGPHWLAINRLRRGTHYNAEEADDAEAQWYGYQLGP